MKIDIEPFRVVKGRAVDLTAMPTRVDAVYESKKEYAQILQHHSEALSAAQRVHYAANQFALLVIIQGMDAAGKDGAIRHVMSGVDPEGCEVTSFKQPTSEELSHDFLWRTICRLPPRGQIGIFNRSYYEDVLIARVHPQLLRTSGLRASLLDGRTVWDHRYESINNLETHLHRNGTKIVKIFLHLSKEEQAERFRQRIDELDKNWKFNPADIRERAFWDAYTNVYEMCLTATSPAHAPWFVVPADDKKNARLIVSQLVLDALVDLKQSYPKTTAKRHRELEAFRTQLWPADHVSQHRDNVVGD